MTRHLILFIIVGNFVAVLIINWVAQIRGEWPDGTVSAILSNWFTRWPIILVMAGLIFGHLCFTAETGYSKSAVCLAAFIIGYGLALLFKW